MIKSHILLFLSDTACGRKKNQNWSLRPLWYVMPEFSQQKNVIILCDSWYMKQNRVSIVDEYENLDLIGNARSDSVIYDIAPAPTVHRGRPAKHGRRLSIEDDFTLSDEPNACFLVRYRPKNCRFSVHGRNLHL